MQIGALCCLINRILTDDLKKKGHPPPVNKAFSEVQIMLQEFVFETYVQGGQNSAVLCDLLENITDVKGNFAANGIILLILLLKEK